MRNGFTLIELLVVVLIIGILVAVAVPQYQKVVFKTRVKSVLPTLRAISLAKSRYYLLHNSYTADLDVLDVNLPYTTALPMGSYVLYEGTALKGGIALSSTGDMVKWSSPYEFTIEVYNNLAVCLGTDKCAHLGPVYYTTAQGTKVYLIKEN